MKMPEPRLQSCIYEGRVRHRRFSPVPHAFDYSIFQLYLDLEEAEWIFRERWLWSAHRPAVGWFRREDHFGSPARPLDQAVRDLVEQRTGNRPRGPVRLLTNLRYFGYCMNPVSFFYCYDPTEPRIECIVAEVHNTPWGERHCYVLPQSASRARGRRMRFEFDKGFHVSPFMDMNLRYCWNFGPPGDVLSVRMENLKEGKRILDTLLWLKRRPLTGGELSRVLVRYPFLTGKVVTAIYWQALRLWLKRCPFYPHPKHGRRKAVYG